MYKIVDFDFALHMVFTYAWVCKNSAFGGLFFIYVSRWKNVKLGLFFHLCQWKITQKEKDVLHTLTQSKYLDEQNIF